MNSPSGKVIQIGNSVVTYEEIPPHGSAGYGYRAFRVSVGGQEYTLAANAKGEVAVTTDHPIVKAHPDVVKAIISAEYR